MFKIEYTRPTRRLLAVAGLFPMFLFASARLAAEDKIVSDFTGKCVRFAFAPDLNNKGKLVAYVQAAKGYAVYRRADSEKAFKQVHAQRYPISESQVAALLGTRKEPAQKEFEGYELRRPSFGARDYLKRTPLAMIFAIYDAKEAAVLGTGYEDCSVDADRSYEYYVDYQIEGGVRSFPEKPVLVRHTEFNIRPPEIAKIVAGEEAAEIHFSPDRGAETKAGGVVMGYNLYKKEGAKAEKVNPKPMVNTAKTPLLVVAAKNLKKGQKYAFYVTAVSFTGKESIPGPETDFMARSLKVPDPVQKVEIKPVHAGFEITWAKHLDTDTAGYNVYEAVDRAGGNPQNKFLRVNKALLPPELSAYTHFTKLESRRYSYRVTVVNKWGNESAMSAAAFLTYKDMEPPPTAEIAEIKEVKNQGLQITWVYKDQAPIKGFTLYRSANTKDEATPLDIKIRPGDRSCVDKTAQGGGNYWYSLRTISANRVLSAYSPPKQFTVAETASFRLPSKLDYEETQEGILIHWKSRPTSGLGYNIYRKIGSEKKVLLNSVPLPAGGTRFIDTGARRSLKPIVYELALVEAAGREKKERVGIEVPVMQIRLLVPEVQIAQSKGGVGFAWQADGDKHLAVYELFRKGENEKDFRKIGEVAGKAGTIEDRSVRKGKYSWYIRKKSAYAVAPVLSKVMALEI